MNSARKIRELRVWGLHDKTQYSHQFGPGLNVIHSKNGAGKTTLLHILANILDGDLGRFRFVSFEKIELVADGDFSLTITQAQAPTPRERTVSAVITGSSHTIVEDEDFRSRVRETLGGRPVYLPAFRTILESLGRRGRGASWAGKERSQPEYTSLVEREIREETARYGIDASPSGSRQRTVVREAHERANSIAQKTLQCREWFGEFVPTVRFPSLLEVESQLRDEVMLARLAVANFDSENFSRVFADILKEVVSPEAPDDTVESVPDLFARLQGQLEDLEQDAFDMPRTYQTISETISTAGHLEAKDEALVKRVLRIYASALAERTATQEEQYKTIQRFQDSVNRFLGPEKQLEFPAQGDHSTRAGLWRSQVGAIIRGKDKRAFALSRLSSGERHILTVLFSVTHMSHSDGAVLIDEPELSLHVDWQRLALGEIQTQAGDRQVIACTHSPEVAADHPESLCGLQTSPWLHSGQDSLFPDDLESD